VEHYRKTRKAYTTFNAGDKAAQGCTLCKEIDSLKIVQQNETMFVIPNRVAYDMFEGRRVTDHLMVIPRRHTESIGDFTDDEKLDQMNIIADYEARGYNVYARAIDSSSRSVKHQHTHFIKLVGKKPQFIFYVAKPHLLIDK
jgi:ATP adenylyltransferase